jgi:hypothetical protein
VTFGFVMRMAPNMHFSYSCYDVTLVCTSVSVERFVDTDVDCVYVWGEVLPPQTVKIVIVGSNEKLILVLRVFAFVTVLEERIKLENRYNTEFGVSVAVCDVQVSVHIQICNDCITSSLLGWICARTAPCPVRFELCFSNEQSFPFVTLEVCRVCGHAVHRTTKVCRAAFC